jgi:DNA-binding GntR family transcriptional regulator
MVSAPNMSRGTDLPPLHSQLVYQRLKDVLLNGRVPGGSLLSESDFARQLGVSTTPVHDAVVRLASEGFVEALPRRGIRVVPLSPRDIAEVFELREALEAEAVRLALRHLTDEHLMEIRSASTAARAAVPRRDGMAFSAADVALHNAIAAAAGNRRLHQSLDDLRVWVQRIRFATLGKFGLSGRLAKSQQQHELLVQALQRREGVAEQIVREHISSLKEDILTHMHANHMEFV